MLKKLRLGFAAIVLLAAITATIASHAGAFNGNLTKASKAAGCWTKANTAFATYVTGQTPCPSLPPVNQRQVILYPSGSINVLSPEVDCIDPVTPLCCVTTNANDIITGFICGTYSPEL